MENNNNQKEYPGYVPEPEGTNPVSNDKRVADKGPVRNANYHSMDEKVQPGGNYSKQASDTVKAEDEKTLEDYNDTDPKRDINKQGNSDEKGNPTH